MKVALYARVSSDKQDTDLSISAQMRALKDYTARDGYSITREFVDEAESGRNAARPAFQEMIALARTKSPPFESILVWKLNRFARNRVDSITYKTLLRNKGVEVISINEPVDNSPTGRLLEGVIKSIDEFYSENLGQDIRRGMRENASRGFFNGSRPPYDFRKIKSKDGDQERNKLEPEPEDSAAVQTVQRMFDMASKRPQVTHRRTVLSFYLLSDILFCSCGAALTGHSAKSGKHFYYQCSRKFKQGSEACDARMLIKEKLERLVINQLNEVVPEIWTGS